MKHVRLSIAACAALVTAGVFAAATADENGLTPTIWQKFDGNYTSSGSVSPTWKSTGSTYLTTRMGKALTGAENKDPYTSGLTVGDVIGTSGTWSFVISAKVSATDKKATFSLGSNKNSGDNGTLLFGSGGKGKVQIAFAAYNTAAVTLCSANVATSTSQFHTYALSVNDSVGTFYVDGVAAATNLTVPFTPNSGGLQLFGVYNNLNTKWSIRPADSEVDDLRFYTCALTAEQVQTIAANYPVWPLADELAKMPATWYTFDGNLYSSASTGITFSTTSPTYVASCAGESKAISAVSNYGTGLKYGEGSWTMLVRGKMPSVENGLLISFGKKAGGRNFALATGAAGEVTLSTWANDSAHTDRVSAEVTDAATTFHDYAIVYDSTDTTTSFFVDGGLVQSVAGACTPDTDAYQFGNVFGGMGNTGFAEAGGEIDDLRVYHEALTASDLTTISRASLPYPATQAVAISAPTQRGTMAFYEGASLALNVSAGLVGPFLSATHFEIGEGYTLPVTVNLPDQIFSGTYTLLATGTEGLSAESFEVTINKSDAVTSAETSWDAEAKALKVTVVSTLEAGNEWTGGAGDGLWSTAGNWSLNAVPTADDTVYLKAAVGTTTTIAFTGELVAKKVVSFAAGSAAVVLSGSDNAVLNLTEGIGGIVGIAGDVAFAGATGDAGTYNIASGSTLRLKEGVDLGAAKFAGSGTLLLKDGTVTTSYAYLVENGVFTGFAGTLAIENGTLVNTNSFNSASSDPLPANMTVSLKNGTIKDQGCTCVNVTLNAAIRSIDAGEGTTNTIFVTQANLFMRGNISGAGVLEIATEGRGPQLHGDNSAFAGTLIVKTGDKKRVQTGFYSAKSASENANFILPSTGTGGGTYTYVINNPTTGQIATKSSPLKFGALQMPTAETILSVAGEPAYVQIGGYDADSYLNCKQTAGRSMHIIKTGARKLTIGKDYATSYSPSIFLDEGTLALQPAAPKFVLSVAANTVLDFTEAEGDVTFGEGSSLSVSGGTIKVAKDQLVSFPAKATIGGAFTLDVAKLGGRARKVLAGCQLTEDDLAKITLISDGASVKCPTLSVDADGDLYAHCVKGFVIVIK